MSINLKLGFRDNIVTASAQHSCCLPCRAATKSVISQCHSCSAIPACTSSVCLCTALYWYLPCRRAPMSPLFRCPASHHMSCCAGPHHWVATGGASYPPGPDAGSHAVTFGAATGQHPSTASWGIWSCLTDCPRQHCSSSSSLKAITCCILTTGL